MLCSSVRWFGQLLGYLLVSLGLIFLLFHFLWLYAILCHLCKTEESGLWKSSCNWICEVEDHLQLSQSKICRTFHNFMLWQFAFSVPRVSKWVNIFGCYQCAKSSGAEAGPSVIPWRAKVFDSLVHGLSLSPFRKTLEVSEFSYTHPVL